MADVNVQNNPPASSGGGSGAVWAVVVILLLLVIAWLVFGGGLHQTRTTKVQVNVPGAGNVSGSVSGPSGGGARTP